jgi:hypothetical protein
MRIILLGMVLLVASTSHAAEPNSLAGKWSNTDAKSIGISRIEVSKSGKTWKIRAWAADAEGEHDLGETTLVLLGDEVHCPRCVESTNSIPTEPRDHPTDSVVPKMNHGFAHWDYKFKDSYLVLGREQDTLILDDLNVFKDDSERTNYRLWYVFRKQIDSPTQPPNNPPSAH